MTCPEVREQTARLREIPLETVLAATGAERDRQDKAKWHTAKGILSVTGVKFMNWNQCIGGGGAIDLAIHLKDLRFAAAVEWLHRSFPGASGPGPSHAGPRKALSLPDPDPGNLARVKGFLAQERGIASVIIDRLVASGRLYADRRANAVFILLGKEEAPVGAELRGTSGRPWRGMAPGSCKDEGFFSVSKGGAEGVVLCESAIDAISCAALHPRYRAISTAGARPDPRWLAALIRQENPIFCGFDADPTGESMALAMIALHPEVKRLRPSLHDWNDVLKVGQ